MSVTDPIADLLTRIRNGHMARHERIEVPASRLKHEVLRILAEEGYIRGFETLPGPTQAVLRIELKYDRGGKRAIEGMQRTSRPGRRVYCDKSEIPEIRDGLGVTIVSTSRGVMTGATAQRLGLGGEVLCSVW